MARRQLCRQHLMPPVAQVGAGDDGDFVPAVPIDLAIAFENRIKPGLVERHVCPGVAEQLGKLAALILQHYGGRPVLAFHQHFKDALAECRGCIHALNLNYKTCLLPMFIIRASMGASDAPRDGAPTPHTDGP